MSAAPAPSSNLNGLVRTLVWSCIALASAACATDATDQLTPTADAAPDASVAEPSADAGLETAPDAGGTITLVRADLGDQPLPKLPAEWFARFNAGDKLFDQTFFESQGLGPVFIRAACSSCHADDARGPGAVRKMVVMGADGSPQTDQSELPYGHTVRPQTITGVTGGVEAPEDAPNVMVTIRMPPAVFGRGYLEAIADSEIERVAAEQAQRTDAVSGRINWVTYASNPNADTRFHEHQPGERLIGRFGLKARIATLDDFCADALQGDMGLTSDMRPDELPNPSGADDKRPGVDINSELLNSLADYMRMIRIPTKKAIEGIDTEDASALFEQTQCGACHVPSMHTDPEYALPPLADIDAPIYSDLLLHDMGPDFSDGLQDFSADVSEWRTAPLLGLRFLKNYLHDGRASTIEEAIHLHGGEGSEAADSVQRFEALDEASRARLLSFVSAL